MSLISALNALYTFWRKRHYRLFEASVDAIPSTPSAHRVRVDSSPVSSSPLRFLSNMLAESSAQSRAHPDAERDVWELAVWDPLPICLRLFCLFSPGHILVYWLFLPTLHSDPRPSTTILTTVILAALFSFQLSTLQSFFSQQSKDAALIHKEVFNEYDTKYVHPRTQPLMRDVGTQFSENASYNTARDEKYNTVETYTPTIIINRGFKTNPNPNYAKHIDPDGHAHRPSVPARRLSTTPSLAPSQPIRTPAHLRDTSSPLRPNTAIRQPQLRASVGASAGDGGYMGVYSHANSPLRKSASTNFDVRNRYEDVDMRDRSHSPVKRLQSPEKRSSVPAGMNTMAAAQRYGHLKGPGRRETRRF